MAYHDYLTAQVEVEPVEGAGWRLLWPVVYVPMGWPAIVVPAGFQTDFASTPRLLWWLLPPTGRYLFAALIHDWLYDQAGRLGMTRRDADALLVEIMQETETPGWQRVLLFAGVRCFGWIPWRRCLSRNRSQEL